MARTLGGSDTATRHSLTNRPGLLTTAKRRLTVSSAESSLVEPRGRRTSRIAASSASSDRQDYLCDFG